MDDIVEGLIACALKGQPGGVYNLAAGIETSIKELADLINELTGNKTGAQLAEARPWDRSGRRFGTTSKSEKDLGFYVKMDIREGLVKTIEWTKQNKSLIEECIAKHDYFMQKIAISKAA